MSTAHLKKRRFGLEPDEDEVARRHTVELLAEAKGVRAVAVDEKRRRLLIDYELGQTTLKQIEATLREAGVHLSARPWARARRAVLRYLETNELDNAGATASCCSSPPEPR